MANEEITVRLDQAIAELKRLHRAVSDIPSSARITRTRGRGEDVTAPLWHEIASLAEQAAVHTGRLIDQMDRIDQVSRQALTDLADLEAYTSDVAKEALADLEELPALTDTAPAPQVAVPMRADVPQTADRVQVPGAVQTSQSTDRVVIPGSQAGVGGGGR